MLQHTVTEDTIDDIVFDGNTKKPNRKLIAATAMTGLLLDISAQVDVAAGGGADGAVNVEGSLRLISRIRIFDGGNTPRVDVDPRDLMQYAKRRGMNPNSGLALAAPGIQAATQIREQIALQFSDPWSASPYEVHFRPRDPDKYRIEIEWAGVEAVGVANGVLAAALITGGTRSVTVTNLTIKITIEHDPISFLRQLPLFQPFIVGYEKDVPNVTPNFSFDVESPRPLRATLIHALNNQLTTESLINTLTLKDDQRTYRNAIPARTWHEREQNRFGGVEDVTGVDLGYFFADFAQYGRLANCFGPKQGGNPKWVFDVTGGANRIIRLTQFELERTPGLTVADSDLPDGHFLKS